MAQVVLKKLVRIQKGYSVSLSEYRIFGKSPIVWYFEKIKKAWKPPMHEWEKPLFFFRKSSKKTMGFPIGTSNKKPRETPKDHEKDHTAYIYTKFFVLTHWLKYHDNNKPRNKRKQAVNH
jgi:hypothetical protein